MEKKVFTIEYSDIRFDSFFESLEAITEEKVSELLEFYNMSKANFALNTESLMHQIFYANDSEYWLLRAIKTVYRLKNKILATKAYFGNFKKYYGITIEEAISNLESFYKYAEEFGYSENENLLIAYIQYCKNSRPVLYVPKNLLMGDTEESFYIKGISNITQGLDNLQKEIERDKWISNASFEDITTMTKRDFKHFLVLKFRLMDYEIKGLSKGTAFVAVKEDKSTLIEHKNTKSKTSLKSIETALDTMNYLSIPELCVYSMSDFTQELIDYATDTDYIKLFGRNEIEKLTKI